MSPLIPILLVPIFVLCVISISGAIPVLSFEKIKLTPLQPEESRRILSNVLANAPNIDHQWLADSKLSGIGVFRADGLFGTPQVIAWEKDGEATWLCGYLLADGQCHLDLVTELSDGTSLTSATSKDGHSLPNVENAYLQSLNVSGAKELMEHHQRGLEFLRTQKNLRPKQKLDFVEMFEASIREQGRHIRRIPFWYARIPYWFLVRTRSLHNRPIAELH